MKPKQQKREEGEIRNEEWRSLTPRQQFDSLCKRRGNCRRQFTKLRPIIFKEE